VSNLVFPALAGLLPTISRTPVYSTSIQTAKSGKELRAAWWSYPRYKFNLQFEVLRADSVNQEWQTLFGFIGRHWGSFDPFLFLDPEDNAVTAHPFGAGDGSKTQFQLQRTLVPPALLNAPASRAFWPVIGDAYEPVFELTSAPSIYLDGVLKALGTDYTLTNGLVTFMVAPGAGLVLTWTGGFYRRVRLDTDEQDAERIVLQIWETKSLDLISVK
jgi:uncharacterized protein (TIGR02217 family)